MFYVNFILHTSPLKTRVQILTMLCEGSSMRSISRVADVSINTVTKLLVDAGKACADFHDEKVRDVKARRVQCDEIWSFTYAKQKNVAADEGRPDALATLDLDGARRDSKLISPGWSAVAMANTPRPSWTTWRSASPTACSSRRTATRPT